MKIRSGFVSNSSSSSFCIYGCVALEENDDYKLHSELETKCVGTDLSLHTPPYSSTYIGRDFTSIKDEETGAQFKASVRAKVREVLGKNIPDNMFSAIERSWYDG